MTSTQAEGPSKRWMLLWAAEVTAGLAAVATAVILLAAFRDGGHWDGVEVAVGLVLSFLTAGLAGPLIAGLAWQTWPGWIRVPPAALVALVWSFVFSRIFFHVESSGLSLGFEWIAAAFSGALLAAMPVAVYAGLRRRGLLPTVVGAVLATGVGFAAVSFAMTAFALILLGNLA